MVPNLVKGGPVNSYSCLNPLLIGLLQCAVHRIVLEDYLEASSAANAVAQAVMDVSHLSYVTSLLCSGSSFATSTILGTIQGTGDYL